MPITAEQAIKIIEEGAEEVRADERLRASQPPALPYTIVNLLEWLEERKEESDADFDSAHKQVKQEAPARRKELDFIIGHIQDMQD